MKRIKIIGYRVFFTLLCGLLVMACTDSYKFSPGGTSLGFTVGSASYPTFFEGADRAPLSVDILLNAEPSQPITLNYTVSSSTDAQLGVQYENPNNGSITIQPGSGRYVSIDVINLLAAGYAGEDNGRRDSYEITITPSDQYAINAIGRSSTTADVFAQCVFDAGSFVGDAHLEDGFTPDEYTVSISQVDETTLRLTGFLPEGSGDLTYTWTFSINPLSGVVTVPYQIFTTDNLFGTPYSNWAVQGAGNFDICNRVLTLTLTHTVDAGSYGQSTHKIIWP